MKLTKMVGAKPVPQFAAFQKAVADNWRLIDLAVTREIDLVAKDELPEPFDSAFDRGSPQRDYGRGYWGIAYPTNYPRWTVKITADPMEGPIAQFICDTPSLRNHPGVARFLQVWRIRRKVRIGKNALVMYVIVRENIEPVALAEVPRDAVRALNAQIDSVNEYLDAIYEHRFSHDDLNVADFRKEWLALVRGIRRIPMLSNIGSFMERIEALGPVIMHDVTVNNIGWRIHSFEDFSKRQSTVGRRKAIIHDVGHSSNGLGLTSIDNLPRLERNPPIPYLDEFEQS